MPVSIVQGSLPPDLFGFGGYDVGVNGNQVFVVYERFNLGILLARSDDGGLSFSPPTLVQGPVSGGYATLSSLVIDGTGNPVVSYIEDKNGATYQVRRSTDGGLTFGDPVTANELAPGGEVCECCTADLLAAGDSIWMVYRNNNQNLRDIWVARSTDLAASFGAVTDVDSTDWLLNFCPIAGPRMARAGDTLVTGWMSGASGNNRIYLSTLHAGTMQAGSQLAFPPVLTQSGQSQADVTASGDTIGLVYLESSTEIVFHYTTNGTEHLANQSTRFADPGHTLQYPSITFRNGVFHLVYADPTGDQVLYRRGLLTESSPSKEPSKALALSMFPNPTTGTTSIQTDGTPIQALRVTDIQGRIIHDILENQLPANSRIDIDLRNSPPGIYFVRVETINGWYWGKIVKQ